MEPPGQSDPFAFVFFLVLAVLAATALADAWRYLSWWKRWPAAVGIALPLMYVSIWPA